MNYQKRREAILNKMESGSMAVLYSGTEIHVSADEYAKFEANRNFFYLTGLRRENMALLLDKAVEPAQMILFIEEADETMVRWTGKRVSVEEAKTITGLEKVQFISSLETELSKKMVREDVGSVYFDTYRHSISDMPDYNQVKAKEFAAAYPGIPVKNLHPLVAAERMWKDEDEVAVIREAIKMTGKGLERILKQLRPGRMEYMSQADFEYFIFCQGADGPAFPTIAGSGSNGTMLHYNTNREECREGSLLLLDLGARVRGYNADITRTYPVSGTFSQRQKQVYDIVLAANREVAAKAKPGMTTVELNEICKKVLAEGLIGLGLIEKEEEVTRYYMHGVSHHLGIDVHDVTVASGAKLRPGAVITDEPGLYIDEWEIGIRIEDDLLITEDGAEVLSADIMRTTEEIEDFMRVCRESGE